MKSFIILMIDMCKKLYLIYAIEISNNVIFNFLNCLLYKYKNYIFTVCCVFNYIKHIQFFFIIFF